MLFIPEGVRLIYLLGMSALLYLIGTMIFIAIGSMIIDGIDKAIANIKEV